MQDTETPPIKEAGCTDTALHSFSSQKQVKHQTPQASPILHQRQNTAHQCYVHTTFPPPPAFAHPYGEKAVVGCGDNSSLEGPTMLPVFGRCCVSRKEFSPDRGLQRGGFHTARKRHPMEDASVLLKQTKNCWQSRGTGCPERVWSLLLWRH